jgi:hypothetical protein
MRAGRTFELWVLVLILLLGALEGFLRLQAAIYTWSVLVSFDIVPGPLYLAVSGAIWGLALLAAALGLFFRQLWAPGYTRVVVVVLALAYWADRLAFTRTADAQANWPFMAGVTALALAFVFSVLALDRQKRFFEG